MDPWMIGLIGTFGLPIVMRGVISGYDRISISINKKKPIDPHYIRRLESENGMEPTELCHDPFCRECFTGITIDVEIKPRERIVDGYLVPVPRVVPDDAHAWAEVDTLTENIKIYWNWVDFAGREKKIRTMTPKVEVKEID